MDVEVRFINNDKGKGLFAKRIFKKGEVIFVEDPLVCCQFSWNATYDYKACNHCLKPLESAEENARRLTGKPDLILPFPECCTTNKSLITTCQNCYVQYCSSNCQMEANSKYHLTLCVGSKDKNTSHPLEQLEEAWKHIHYPPEASTIMIIPRILATIHQSSNKEEILSQFLKFHHKTTNEEINLSHKLIGEKFKDQVNLLHSLLLQAITTNGIEQLLSLDGFHSLLALLGTNGQGVGTSAISQWVLKTSQLTLPQQDREQLDRFIDQLYEDMGTHSGIFLNNEGVALYSLQSCCNHSCLPNAEPSFVYNSSKLSLVAVNDIKPDDEICISYLDECNLERSRHSRRKELKMNYLFLCNCQKCEEQTDDPDMTSEDEEDEEMSE